MVFGVPGVDIVAVIVEALNPGDTNMYEVRLNAQMMAALESPKSLDELQSEPTENRLGFEAHHIVEQNPENIEKRLIYEIAILQKFGAAAIDAPSNIVWVPRMRHEDITSEYNSIDGSDPLRRRLRDVINQREFSDQRAFGLEELRKHKAPQ